MSTAAPPSIASTIMFWAGWALTLLVALGLTASGAMKLALPDEVSKEFNRLGFPFEAAFTLAAVELVCVVLYLFPQTCVLAAIVLTGYLGGATATHVRVHDNFIPPIVFGILIWLAFYLRDRRIRELIPFRSKAV